MYMTSLEHTIADLKYLCGITVYSQYPCLDWLGRHCVDCSYKHASWLFYAKMAYETDQLQAKKDETFGNCHDFHCIESLILIWNLPNNRAVYWMASKLSSYMHGNQRLHKRYVYFV